MHFLRLEDFVPNIMESCITMDNGTQNDNGALACNHQAMPAALLSQDDQSAANNLIGCIPAGVTKQCIMCGHGADGWIGTGGGQMSNYNESVAGWDQDYWSPMFAPLKNRVLVLRLWGCHVGANQDGVDLLFFMAQLLNCTVQAPTGLMNCGGGQISFENGSVFQTATPTSKPAPIPPPTPETLILAKSMSLRVLKDGNISNVPLEAVDRVFVLRRSTKAELVRVPLEKVEGYSLLRMINFANPIDLPGPLLAQKTAELEVQVEGQTLHFAVFNGRIVQDEQNPKVIYQVSPVFSAALHRLF